MLSFIQFLLENRLDFVKDIYAKKGVNTSHDPGVLTDAGAIVDHFATNADPSQRKVHTQWIMNKYNRGEFRQEDHPRVRQALSLFDQYKSRLERKDLNQYNSLAELEGAVAGLSGPASNKQAKKEAKESGAELIHNQDGVTVHHIKTKEASCQYGAGTRWCTAATENNMFDRYNSTGNLYIIQHGGRKFQFHQPYGGHAEPLLADEEDNPIQMADVSEDIRKSLAKSTHYEIQKVNLHLGNDKMPSEQIDELSRSKDGYTRLTAMMHPALSKKRMDELIQDGERLSRLAKNPSATSEQLTAIFNHPRAYSDDKETALRHPNVSSDLIDQNIGKNYSYDVAISENPNLKPKHIHKLLNSDENPSEVRGAAVSHPNATTEHIRYAIENDPSREVREKAAYNPNIDDDTLVKAAMDGSHYGIVASSARANPKFTAKHINRMIDVLKAKKEKYTQDDLKSVLSALYDQKHTPENISHAIATEQPDLVQLMAGHPYRNKEHEDQIMNMPDDKKFANAKQIVLNSGTATKEHFAKALAHENDDVTRVTAAIGTPHPEHIMQALKHPHTETRYAATLNRHATPEHWQVAAQDEIPMISDLAKKKLERVAQT